MRRYRRWLARANDNDCLTLVWAAHALQSGHAENAARFINFPMEAATENVVNDYSVHSWELETIVTSLLTTPKDKERKGLYHSTDLRRFESLCVLVNYLRTIENEEYARSSSSSDVLEELYRIGQRQFHWQRGPSIEQLYRYAFVYGQGECGAFFEQENGIAVSAFIQLSFAMFGIMMTKPWTDEPDVSELKLWQDNMKKTLALQSIELNDARKSASRLNRNAVGRLGKPLMTAYMPSLLRQRPMIKIAGPKCTYIAPLPPLVMNRATSGLYYDIKQGPDRLRTEANARFEDYIRKLANAYFPHIETLKGKPYGPKGAAVDTPDCLLLDGKQVTVAIECKATKLTFEGQYSDDPMTVARQGFEQIAKGVFQLWRFFSHVRRGFYTEHHVSPSLHGIVLTMDSWMQMAAKLREEVFTRAKELASADKGIIEEDMRMVVFVTVQELNDTFAQTDMDGFLTVLENAVSEKYLGHGFPEIARDSDIARTQREFPMDLSDVLPWWSNVNAPDQQ